MFVHIIGGSGFIGTKLSRRLTEENNKKFSIVDKVKSTIYPEKTVIGDVRSLDELRAAILDGSVIINLAAEHRDDVTPLSLYDDVNVTGAKNICIVANEKKVKTIIFTSSVAVYGFAPLNTDETGAINPFNDYGRTKYEAEKIFSEWQLADPENRTLVIVRPTVVFGEQNRGNVYNLLRQITSGRFMMIGDGRNRKSMAYVENLAAFLDFSVASGAGRYIYNFIDKPDLSMNSLVKMVNKIMGKPEKIGPRLPYIIGFAIGKCFDIIAKLTGRKFTISSIRVKKFCSDSVFNTKISETGFVSPIPLEQALDKTIRYEFIESNEHQNVFYSE